MRPRLIVVLVVVLLVVLLGVNAVTVSGETKPAHADIGHIVHLAGGDLQVREDGSAKAPAIVLLHGFAASMHWWDGVLGALSAQHLVIRFDLLGHGGSAKPSSGYTMEHQAQLVEEALTQLGVHRALIVGHSMGGLVATALATRDRALVAGIVLIDSPPTSGAGKLPFVARLVFVPVLGQALRQIISNGMVEKALQEAFVPAFKLPHQFVSDFWRMTYTSYVSSSSDSDAYLKRESLDSRLTAIGLPVLALYGTEDKLVSPSSVHADYTRVPGAQVVAISRAGHSPMVEKPSATSRLILAFASRTLH